MIKGDKKKVRKITKKINELKDLNLEKLTKPVSAFVTFETEEGYLRAL
jgi:metal-responsive CopG/Arc/MetJ family transcriptional regulator